MNGTRWVKLTLLGLWVFAVIPLVWILTYFKKLDARNRLSCFWYKTALKIMGVSVTVDGQVDTQRPLLLVSNHITYLDIFLLGSIFPVRFVAKSEIASWPVIGFVSRMCGVVFVDRKATKVSSALASMKDTLSKGEVVCVFPEATTGHGISLLPFKSSMFSICESTQWNGELMVQPVALTYTSIRSLPVDLSQWPQIAWIGDAELLPHALELFSLGHITAHITLLPTTTLRQHADRKALAAYCQGQIADAIAHMQKRS